MVELLRARWMRTLVSVLLFVGLGFLLLTVRLFLDGRRLFSEAEQAQTAGEPWQNVVMQYENAAKTYFPGNPYSKRAIWKLSLLAKGATMRGETAKATYIWEVVRRSAVSQRHVMQPYQNYLKQAQTHLAKRRGGAKNADGWDDGLEDPSVFWSIILYVGLLLWIFGAFFFIMHDGGRRAIILFGICLPGCALWIIAAMIA
ncbi:MAG: hypothetical protein JXR76_16605 [Deltaproteobacteria bacterium]|nr:hypothetical protein [Deltaproteobacteria bacterium]